MEVLRLLYSDADITDVFPDVEIATPGIEYLDKAHFSTYKWYPLVLYHIIQTFMMATIQELYHTSLAQKSMIYYNTMIDALFIGANVDELDGNKRHIRVLESQWR